MKSSSFAVHLVATTVSPLADTDRLRITDVRLNPGNTSWVISWGIWPTLGWTSGVINGKYPARLHKHGQSCQISSYCSGSNKRGLRGCLGGCVDGFWPRLQLNVLGQRIPAKKAKAFFNCRTCNAILSQLGKGPQRWNKYVCIMRMRRLLSARTYTFYASELSPEPFFIWPEAGTNVFGHMAPFSAFSWRDIENASVMTE